MKFPSKFSTSAHPAAKALMLVSALFVAGCSMDDAALDDNYTAENYQERYPIRVAEAPVKMNVSAKAGTLRGDQINSVISFAQDARNSASSVVTVRYASGSSKSRIVAQQTVQVLADQGLPRSMIRTGSYKGSSTVVSLSFNRKVAVTKECGDWSENLAGDNYNEAYPNHGCAMQQNMAAMVANPEDFETARAMSPVMGSTRSAAIKKYSAGEAASAASSGSSSASDASASNQ